MINLLPPHAQKSLTKEYRMRLGTILLSSLLIVEVLLLIFFIPSYYVLNLSTQKLNADLAAKLSSESGESKKASLELSEIKKEIELLKPVEGISGKKPTELLGAILLTKPRGIDVLGFTYSNEKQKVIIQLSGVSSTREELLEFRKLLLANAEIADAKFSSSFITKKTDIDFTIVISYK